MVIEVLAVGVPTQGNDTITGSVGADVINLLGGNDTFIIMPGQTAPGETINGGKGTDTIQIDGGGPVSFAGMTITGIESIVMTDLVGTALDLSGAMSGRTNLAASITSAAGANDSVHMGVWNPVFTVLNSMFTAGVETVTWTNGQAASSTAHLLVGGQISIDQADTNDVYGWASHARIYDADGTLRHDLITRDDAVQVELNFNGTGVITSRTVTDVNDVLGFRSMEHTFTDGVRSQVSTILDNGISVTRDYATNGDAVFEFRQDLDDAKGWDTQTTTFESGVRSVVDTAYDLGGNISRTIVTYSAGILDTKTTNFADGRITVQGGVGDNVIHSTGAAETLSGGGGADTFLFMANIGIDVITDFENGTDLLDLTARGIDTVAELEAAAYINNIGSDFEIAFKSGDSILLKNFSISQISDSDFVLDTTPAPLGDVPLIS